MNEKKPVSKTNWAKVDATPGVPDADIPEVTDEMLDRAVLSFGGMVLRMPRKRGRPRGSGKKQAIKVRIDKDILAQFRATGPGWQTRINDVLRRGLKTLKVAKRA